MPILRPALRSLADHTPVAHRLRYLRLQPSRTYVSEASPPPDGQPRRTRSSLQRAVTFARYTGYFCLSSVFGVLVIGAGIFIHDAFTYSSKHIDRVPVSPLALHPELGGPKNLPLVSAQVDDDEDEEHEKIAQKPRLVIVGCGWGVRRLTHMPPLFY
jgi:hypothetical protein